MTISEEYKEIYKREVEADVNRLIFVYTQERGSYLFQPLSHNCKNSCSYKCSNDCHKKLGQLMRKNLVFYCYGEDEVVSKMRSGFFNNLEVATRYAYHNRLPKRQPDQDGLPGEILLDLLVQTLVPNSYKLAVRTIFRQDDNNEIKGYDLTYFTNDNGQIALWLGQAKMGSIDYCKTGINSDLIEKYKNLYLSKQVYFVSEKQVGLTEEGKVITEAINQLNMININNGNTQRSNELIKFLVDRNVVINIPCLLAYGKGSVYENVTDVEEKIKSEIENLHNYFTKQKYHFDGFQPNIIFFVFPISDLEKLRGEEGFYAELC